jgi:hypothetical protein
MFKTQIVTPKFNITMHSVEVNDALELSAKYHQVEHANIIIMNCETGEVLYSLTDGEVDYVSVELAVLWAMELLGDK